MFLAFLNEFDPDLKETFLEKLRVLWTHGSTGLEGNTLTLGETHAVLSQGLTISGKPLSHHLEVVRHSRAIDLVYSLCQGERPMVADDLFTLHRAVQTAVVVDIYQPVGAWEVEPNSAAVVLDGEVGTNDTYALPRDVPTLMDDWLEHLNGFLLADSGAFDGVASFAWLHAGFVRIHPFADGNGRMARLVANLPALRAGFPPVLIPLERRVEYIELLARWKLAAGRPKAGEPLVADSAEYGAFVAFSREVTRGVNELIGETRRCQEARRRES
jgi:Fic family protein